MSGYLLRLGRLITRGWRVPIVIVYIFCKIFLRLMCIIISWTRRRLIDIMALINLYAMYLMTTKGFQSTSAASLLNRSWKTRPAQPSFNLYKSQWIEMLIQYALTGKLIRCFMKRSPGVCCFYSSYSNCFFVRFPWAYYDKSLFCFISFEDFA